MVSKSQNRRKGRRKGGREGGRKGGREEEAIIPGNRASFRAADFNT